MPQEANRTARIEARIAPEALSVVKQAAELQGRSLSDFIVAAAGSRAGTKITRYFLSPALYNIANFVSNQIQMGPGWPARGRSSSLPRMPAFLHTPSRP